MAADDLLGGERTEAVRRGASCRTASARAEAPSETDGAARASADLVRMRASAGLTVRGTGQTGNWPRYLPTPGEQARLAATLGATLRALRAEYGLTVPALAERAAAHPTTVYRIESGERRPRPAMLASLAYGLDPDRVGEITARLVEAAGPSLRPDTPGGIRRRQRRMAKARRAVQRETWRLARAADEARSEGFHLLCRVLRKLPLDPPEADSTPEDLARQWERLTALEATRLRSERLFAARDALIATLARPRHPLEVPRSDHVKRILDALDAEQ
jgi:Helix-turn-helix.